MRYLITIIVLLTPFSYASDAYVATDYSKGQGILRKIGDTCLLYTPAHVASKVQNVEVSTRLHRDLYGSLLTTYPQDLAVVQLEDKNACIEVSWKDEGIKVDAILDVVSQGQMSVKHKRGRVETFDIDITAKAMHSTFDFKLKREDKDFNKGMSGSLITVGGYPIGMLLSVRGDTGTALRIDTIADLTRTLVSKFATEEQKNDIYSRVERSREKSPNTPRSNESTDNLKTNQLKDKQTLKGTASPGAYIDYPFTVTGNSAYLVTNNPQLKDSEIKQQILDIDGNILFSESTWRTSRRKSWGFGFTQPGQYTLRVIGGSWSGPYSLNFELKATPEEMRSTSNVVSNGDILKGFIASGSYAEYTFKARGNTAYRVTNIKREESSEIEQVVLDGSDKTLFRESTWRTSSGNKTWGFGVTSPGIYKLRIVGSGWAGNYALKFEEMATPEELSSSSNVLTDRDTVKGYISKGTFGEFKFTARGNTAYLIKNIPQKEDAEIEQEVLNPDGRIIFRESTWRTSRDKEWGFGVTEPGEYTLRVRGAGWTGSYGLEFRVIATTEELLSSSNTYKNGDIIQGMISKGTFAEYRLKPPWPIELTLTSLPQRSEAEIVISILNENRRVVATFGSLRTGRKAVYNYKQRYPNTGDYFIRVTGSGWSGRYSLKIEEARAVRTMW